MLNLKEFLIESFEIEGIFDEPTQEQIIATTKFLDVDHLTGSDVKKIVTAYQPDAVIRDRENMNVRVGTYYAPPGGPLIVKDLKALLVKINEKALTPWEAHCAYETLHPFTDGNGRSGRTIWLWHMYHINRDPKLGFLHSFYYQTLQETRK